MLPRRCGFFVLQQSTRMDFTINLIYVILVAIGLIVTLITFIVKSNRESERFESWLKTHEKEIKELKSICNALHTENKILKDSITSQNSISMQENRRLESMIGQLAQSIGQIDVKLSFLIDGKLKSTNHEG